MSTCIQGAIDYLKENNKNKMLLTILSLIGAVLYGVKKRTDRGMKRLEETQ
jgi:hypothetical protein